MNADPEFAKSIVATVDKQIDQQTIDAHVDAPRSTSPKNEQHVIFAYAAMWIVAALFVVFLWRRQQALKAEIAQLRKDLDAAAQGVEVTSSHVLFIPGVLMVGMFLGFILGARAARNQFDLAAQARGRARGRACGARREEGREAATRRRQ